MGKKGSGKILAFYILLIVNLLAFMGGKVYAIAHSAIGTVQTSFGSIPSESSLTFTAYIVGRPSEKLYNTSGGCGYYDATGAWYVGVGNFPTSWSNGEVLHIDFTDSQTDETGSDEVTLSDQTVQDNGGLTVLTAPAETVSAPSAPSGPSTGYKGQSLGFTVSGGSSSLGHPLEYQIDWGDGLQSSWGSGAESHTFSSTGTYQVKARARCSYHNDKVSGWSSNHSVTISLCNLTVNISPGGSGTVAKSPDRAGYDYGESVQLTASGTGNYSFSDWTGDLSGSTNPQNITMNGDKSVTANFAEETVSVPNTPSGPSTGFKGQSLSFLTGGSVNNMGHSVEYQFDWGDGNQSAWVPSGSASHAYATTGTFQVKARARCQTHTSVVSGWSTSSAVNISLCTLGITVNASGTATVTKNPDKAGYDWNESVQLTVNPSGGYGFDHWGGDLSGSANPANITMNGDKNVTAYTVEETISTPNTPSGPGSGIKGQSLSFTTGGSSSSLGHSVEYQFDWGDGAQSTWGNSNGSHTYTATGTYSVKARARCQTHTDKVSAWSSVKSVVVSLANLSITINPSGGGSVTKNPDKTGYDYNESVQLTATPTDARYRFQNYSGDLSGATNPQSITMSGNKSVTANFEKEVVTVPATPTGPSYGMVGQSLTFNTSGSSSSFGHSVEYRFNWGDGTYSSWNNGSATHTYSGTGSYQVRAQARCKTHTDISSNWSNYKIVTISTYTLTININPPGAGTVNKSPNKADYNPGETVTLTAISGDGSYRFDYWSGDVSGNANPSNLVMNSDKTVTAHFEQEVVHPPTKAYGPSELYMGQEGTYQAQGARSTFQHQLEYRFDWGDGTISGWGLAEQSHVFDTTGVYEVVSQARCKDHTQIASGWSTDIRFVWVYGCSLTISIEPPEAGVVERMPTKESYRYLTDVELSPVANSGYTFSHWSGYLSGSANPEHVTMDTTNRYITAHFMSTNEVVTIPATLTGPDSGVMGMALEFKASGSSSNQGNDVEYQFDFGDGNLSEWADGTGVHSYTSTGLKEVRARARSKLNTSVVSEWTDAHEVTIIAYSLTVDIDPPQAGTVDIDPDRVEYAAYDIVNLLPRPATGYAFDHWSGDADGTVSSIEIIMSSNKQVVAHFVEVKDFVTTPDSLEGPEDGFRNQLLSFLTGGSQSSLGSNIEYQFDWGDGEYSDWGVTFDQSHDNITKYTSPNGSSGLLSMGYLVDNLTGEYMDARLTVTGGIFDMSLHSEMGSNPSSGTDAHAVFNGKIDMSGAISYIDDADSALVFDLSGLDPSFHYNLIFYSNAGDYGWDQASLVTLSGVESFVNESSTGADNNGYLLFSGPDDPSVKLPADNTVTGYIAKYTAIQPGADGYMRLKVTSAGSSGNEGKGKYANGLMLQVIDPATSEILYTAYNDMGWGDRTASHRFLSNGAYRIRSRARSIDDTTNVSEWSSYYNVSISGCYLFTAEVPSGSGLITKSPVKSDYDYGEIVTLTATAFDGYKFTHWNDNNSDSAFVKRVAMNDNKTFVAHFTERTAVEDMVVNEVPAEFRLLQNYPNPFNPETSIQFEIPEAMRVRISVYNMNGQIVNTITDSELAAGQHMVIWRADDYTGHSVPSGVYLYRIEAGHHQEVKKMILMR